MKKLLILAALLPATVFAQIYPLHVYASATRDNGQEMKFLRSPSGVTYVGTCKGTGDSKLCNLAKDGSYKTSTGIAFTVKENKLMKNGEECTYVGDKDEAKLECGN